LVVTRHRGHIFATLRGPETKATVADCPAEGEWLGIRFRLGTFMPRHPAHSLIDRRDQNLPAASRDSFWLDGSQWQFPEFENADTFVARLARNGVIVRDRTVEEAMHGERVSLSKRSAQRHFLQATAITYTLHRQIERARWATNLLKQGASILDTVYDAGYFDQSHLTRSLGRLIGQTPRGIMREDEQLSFLYKTTTAGVPMIDPVGDHERIRTSQYCRSSI
jgi:AraC-like DNA-binding protein